MSILISSSLSPFLYDLNVILAMQGGIEYEGSDI